MEWIMIIGLEMQKYALAKNYFGSGMKTNHR